LSIAMKAMESTDEADAVVACVSLVFALAEGKLEPDWERQPAWASDTEWTNRYQEGLVVKTGS
jgi:hypothetical protein